ncbi:DinB family protein [Paenibacillus sp. MBLB4367]|uniref:DinB family protein n=1 Tax=Paenibacillus sp. MBLB4367 TaxID=3384767 RepID=UPI003907E909
MNEAFVMRDLLIEEIGTAVRTTIKLFAKIGQEDWVYRPHPNTRTLNELAIHLALVPATDLAILQEQPEASIRRIEHALAGASDAKTLSDAMESGLEALKQYMFSLDAETLLTKSTKPFYLDHAATQAKWLVEITTHVHHHRAQLFQYLKQLGYPVSMFDLY